MEVDFKYDVFLSHCSKDKHVVRTIAERLRNDGLMVWFDEWEIKPGDSIPAKIEDGLDHSHVLVLCMSQNAFGSDWARLEAGTFQFRDPLNKNRRFLPVRLDDAPIKGTLAQFLHINWIAPNREREYEKLLDACRPSSKSDLPDIPVADAHVLEKNLQIDTDYGNVISYAFTPDGKRLLTGHDDNSVRLWDLLRRRCLREFIGHTDNISTVAWSANQRYALSGSYDNTVRLWDIRTGKCLRVNDGHTGWGMIMEFSADFRHAISGGDNNTMRLWNVESGRCLRVIKGHMGEVRCVAWSPDQCYVVSGAFDNTIRIWETKSGRCIRVLEGHLDVVRCVAWSPDQRYILSGSDDTTIRLWDLRTGHCLRILEGHEQEVKYVAWRADQRYILSGCDDHTLRLWDVETGRCLCILDGHFDQISSVVWSSDQRHAFSGDADGLICVWNLSEYLTEEIHSERAAGVSSQAPEQIVYTNAKVLLVGESGVGKTGLSKRLAMNSWQPSDSTVGAWATQWKLPITSSGGIEREIWLWDFGGQADQRLIHQLYMDETALAVLVFDGQKDDVFESLVQWDRDITRASHREFSKLLVAGRVDAGGLRVSRSDINKFVNDYAYSRFLETSAKSNLNCEELKQAIQECIRWDEIPCHTTEVLFKKLKEEIIRLKDAGKVLMRFNELRETLQLNLPSEYNHFTDKELHAVLSLLSGPGVVWELNFGSLVLLQPERINAYAQAVIQTLRSDEEQRGCLLEERVLKGDLAYESSMKRLDGDEERFILLAMQQLLVERGLCFRQPTEKGNMLIFPSYYRRERPEQLLFPAVLVTYRFTGFLDEIYTTLVVRLYHTSAFKHDHLWRYAADFKTNLGKQLGVKLTRLGSGVGELEVFFDPDVSMEERIIFSKYVHEHLMQHAHKVERLRHYVCLQCNTSVGNREIAMRRLDTWVQGQQKTLDTPVSVNVLKSKKKLPTIICSECEKRIVLWDELEQCFANPKIQQQVYDMRKESDIVLTNESKERALVGEVISTVALAGQLCREFNVSDKGIDMEIEFVDDMQEATGEKLYLQLKSGRSHLREREEDGVEIFTIKDERHIRYWMAQKFPVLLVIRNSKGEIRWMEIQEYLKNKSKGKKPVKHIVFTGERFDVMSVRRWREKISKQ